MEEQEGSHIRRVACRCRCAVIPLSHSRGAAERRERGSVSLVTVNKKYKKITILVGDGEQGATRAAVEEGYKIRQGSHDAVRDASLASEILARRETPGVVIRRLFNLHDVSSL